MPSTKEGFPFQNFADTETPAVLQQGLTTRYPKAGRITETTETYPKTLEEILNLFLCSSPDLEAINGNGTIATPDCLKLNLSDIASGNEDTPTATSAWLSGADSSQDLSAFSLA